MVVERGLGVCGHARPRLGTEVLDDHFLHVPVVLAKAAEREQGVDPLFARLPDPDQDPARERDRELTREPDRLQAAGRDLVGRGPMRPSPLPEPVSGCLEHDPHRGAGGAQELELFPGHDAGVQVRQEAGLLEDELRAPREVLERRLAAERTQLIARDLVAQLGLVPEREERFATACSRAGARDRQHFVLGKERSLAASRRPRERAVAANVSAERRQRDEDLRRVRDEEAEPQTTGLREQVLERRRDEIDGGDHVRREHTSMRRVRIRLVRRSSVGRDEA